jgi:hypothetical protein
MLALGVDNELIDLQCDETKPQCAGCMLASLLGTFLPIADEFIGTRRGVECHYATNVLAKRQAKSSVHPILQHQKPVTSFSRCHSFITCLRCLIIVLRIF